MAEFPALALIGRSAELGTLLGLLRSSTGGPLQVALIHGEAGIGKSRLLMEVVDQARDRGFRVLSAEARELEQTLPFSVLAEALELRHLSVGDDRSELAQMLVGEMRTEDASLGLVDTPTIQLRLLEGFVNVVERFSLAGPVLLAVDDLHWADLGSLLVFEHLARRLSAQPILLLGTLRPVPRRGELDEMVASLGALGCAGVTLGPLARDEVALLVEQTAGAPPAPGLMEAADAAGGNPLYIAELVSALQNASAIEIAGGRSEIRRRFLPPPLQLIVLSQLRSLSPETIEILRIASILGSTFPVAHVSAVLGRPTTTLMPSLVEARTAGVLGDADPEMAFRHELVRDAIYLDIPAAMRRALHVQVGGALADIGAEVGLVAAHYWKGATPGDVEAKRWLRRAGRDALRGAPAVAVDLLTKAFELARPSDLDRSATAAELFAALAWSGRLDDAETQARDVLSADASLDVQKQIRVVLAEAMVARGRVWDARHAMDRLLERVPSGDPDRPVLMAFGAWTRLFTGDLPGALARIHEALAAAEKEGDASARSVALCGKSMAALFSGDIRRAVDVGWDAIRCADADPKRHLDRYPARLFLARALFEADQSEEADGVLREGLRLSERMGIAPHLPFYHAELGLQCFLTGRWDDAVAEAEAASEDPRERLPGAALVPPAVLALISLHRGELGTAEKCVRGAEREHEVTGAAQGSDLVRWARALLDEAVGNGRGIDALIKAWDHPEARPTTEVVRVGADLVRYSIATGRTELAASVVGVVEDAVSRNPTASWRAAALRCTGLHERDPAALTEAAALYRLGPRVHERALACEDAAAALTAAGRGDEAVELLVEAVELHEQLRAVRDLARTDAALRGLGVRRGRRASHRQRRNGWESLTSTELDVIRLAKQGLTNAEIGRQLFISRRTVETHLAHVFAKLGIHSRVQLAAAAARREV